MPNKLLAGSERIFWVPFLLELKNCGMLSTTEIMQNLREKFDPKGHDADIITNRNDDYFSQKVRNIKSHSSLSEYVIYSDDGFWSLSDNGHIFLNEIGDVVDEIDSILNNTSFDYYDKITFIDVAVLPFFSRKSTIKPVKVTKKVKKTIFYDENIVEGKTSTKTIVVRERSRKLRDKAIEHFTDDDGRIKCCICGYEFASKYGEYGSGYIEIHHKKPVYQYEDKDVDSVLSEALTNLAPVCANCHRMLHHKKGYSFEEVKKIYEDNNKC